MHQGQRQRRTNKDKSPHLVVRQPEVFGMVGKPLPTSSNAGASLRELMARMGHDSERAAMIYLHSSDERQHQIADNLSKLAAEELKRGSKRQGGQASAKRSGTPRARNRKQAS